MDITFMHLDEAWYSSAKAEWCEPFDYQARVRGKLVRAELAWVLSGIFGLTTAHTHVLRCAVEQMNASSLLHDDVLDRDELRRGVPSVWKRYGDGVALVSGMYGYIDGLQRLAELNDLNVVRAGVKSLERLHVGQYLDLMASESKHLLTLEEYGYIATANTGCFFVFLLEACQCLRSLNTEIYKVLESFMRELGVYYRYVNDYCDVVHIPHFEKKGFAMDLEGGPKSFLMILAGDVLIKGPRSADQKNEIIRAYGDAGVFEAAMNLMEQTYIGLQQHLEAVSKLDTGVNVEPLSAFLQGIHFQHDPNDNYYTRVLSRKV